MEIWKNIKGYEGLYQVSNLGEIKSFKLNKERILKKMETHKGYICVDLSFKGKKRRVPVHRIVAEAFIPNPENKKQVDHIDENKLNNKTSNIRWLTNRENVSEYRSKRGNKVVGVHYSKKQKKFISQIYISGVTYSLGMFDNINDAEKNYQKALNNWNKKRIKPPIRRNNGIYKKDVKGLLLKKYKNLKEVTDDGYCYASVSSSCNGKYKHSNGYYRGFIWEKI